MLWLHPTPKPETRNPKPETVNLKLESRKQVPDENLLAADGEEGQERRRWAEVWFKDSPARPSDVAGQVLLYS